MEHISYENELVLVEGQHIARGIKKYKGHTEPRLRALLMYHNMDTSIPYLFADGRVLLVFKREDFAVLYPSVQVFKDKLKIHHQVKQYGGPPL